MLAPKAENEPARRRISFNMKGIVTSVFTREGDPIRLQSAEWIVIEEMAELLPQPAHKREDIAIADGAAIIGYILSANPFLRAHDVEKIFDNALCDVPLYGVGKDQNARLAVLFMCHSPFQLMFRIQPFIHLVEPVKTVFY